MKLSLQVDRRREERYPHSFEIAVEELPGCGTSTGHIAPNVEGRVQNLSPNGFCIVTSKPLRPFAVLRCYVPVDDSGVTVTTLMRVQWTKCQCSGGGEYVSGLEALL